MLKKYTVDETVACWVTFRQTVEAENEEQALKLFNEEGGETEETFIEDAIDGFDTTIFVTKTIQE